MAQTTEAAKAASTDLTGRRQMVKNVLSSWIGQLVFIAAGFVMPHLIDRSLGQVRLGVWDFSWSIVTYFSILQAGIYSSISRYVAGCQAVGDTEKTNRVVNTALAMLTAIGVVVLLVTFAVVWFLGANHVAKLGVYANEARLVILILGIEIAIQTALSTYGGVITGHHHWTLHYGIQAAGSALGVAGMIAVLLGGGGLAWLALAHLCGETVASLVRIALSYRICPTLRIDRRYVDPVMARSMFGWSAKILVPSIGEMLFNQTANLLVLSFTGPAALALYARSSSLVRQIKTPVAKASGILSPSASALQAANDLAAIRQMAISSGRWTALLAFPPLALLAIQGGQLVQIWMGAAYRNDPLVAVLTIGSAGLIIQYPLLGMLCGLDLHGRSGLAHLIAGAVSCLLTYAALRLGFGLLGAAWAVGLPMILTYFVYIPFYISRHVGLGVMDYLRSVFAVPALYTLPFAAVQLACRRFWPNEAVLSLAVGCVVGAAVLAPVYWFYVLPEKLKSKLYAALGRTTRRAVLNQTKNVPSLEDTV